MNGLQRALRSNALFSSTSGALMILLNQQIAKLFGANNNTVFWMVGLALIYFALTIWYEIRKQRKTAIIWIIIQDFIWFLGSFILIIFNPFNVTLAGNLAIGTVALIVLYMGMNQSIELNKTTANNR